MRRQRSHQPTKKKGSPFPLSMIDWTLLLKKKPLNSITPIARNMLITSKNCQQKSRRILPGRRKRIMRKVSSISIMEEINHLAIWVPLEGKMLGISFQDSFSSLKDNSHSIRWWLLPAACNNSVSNSGNHSNNNRCQALEPWFLVLRLIQCPRLTRWCL